MRYRNALVSSAVACAAALLWYCVAPSPSEKSAATAKRAFVGEPTNGDQVPVNDYIAVDQFGYRPEMNKVAVLVDPQSGWNAKDAYVPGSPLEVRRWADGSIVFSGAPVPWKQGATEASSGDRGAWFDFSAVMEPGSYFIFDRKNGARSYRFDIGPDVYRDVLKASMRMFYFNRANYAKTKPFACVGKRCWTQRADYVGARQDSEAHSVTARTDNKTKRDLSGGWWDAGDTNKYVTFIEVVIHQLLSAYEAKPHAFGDDFGIPESGNGLPDLIDEVKVELDWLKKMQAKDLDGGALLKVGDVDHIDKLPEDATSARFYYPAPCSSSTITVASVFPHAALVLRGFEPLKAYAEELKWRAIAAWDWYQGHPKSDSCDDGTIKSGDADRSLDEQNGVAVVAAVYLFALTGEERYQNYVRENYEKTRPFSEDRWSAYDADQGDALLFYTTLPKADPELKAKILERKTSEAKNVEIYGFKPDLDLYRAYMRDESYHWGSNQIRANFANTNYDLIQYKLVDADAARGVMERVTGLLNSFHGVNPMRTVYLTNMSAYGAERSASEIFHSWFRDKDRRYDSAQKSELGPAPGYVPGGPNKDYCKDADPKENRCASSALKKQPPQKAYLDFNTGWEPKNEHDKSWEITEPAIYYQSAYVKLLSKFVD
ncbi:MAG TPA: glycoside hydrolase family 9 protein [Polyangiaceae bacterium]|nr:glycoside hydrolase family 9 protein [Polyangiaceae bacterium]